MNLLLLGDCHFSNRRPCNRRDENYFETMISKFRQVLTIYREYECSELIQVGDFFDSPMISNEVIARIINESHECLTHPIRCIYGQHDIFSHSAATIIKSPLAILEAAKIITILDDDGFVLPDSNVKIYGASFGKPIPTPTKSADNEFLILVHHGMIGAKDIYPGQNITKPDSFLSQYSMYDLIVCGDYHWSFDCVIGDRVILNSGCIIRKTVAENDINHVPGVYLFNTQTREYSRVLLDVLPSEEVLNITDKESHEPSRDLLDLISAISMQEGKKVSWKHLLYQYLEEHNVDKSIIDLIEKCIGEAACQQN